MISTLYGAGNGSSTFNIPDLRGAFVRGWDDARGLDPGRGLATYQDDAFASHTHTYNMKSVTGGSSQGGDPLNLGQATYTTGAAGGTETRPKNYALYYCIKI